MMGLPKKNGGGDTKSVPGSPAIPSEMEDIPMSPMALSVAASTDFGSTPAKSYAGFPKTPGSGKANNLQLDPPSSRLRHSIAMKKAAGLLSTANNNNNSNNNNADKEDVHNLSFDMGEVELLGSNDSLMNTHNPLIMTPFAKVGQANFVTLKEQEKVMDEIKKENFDLKLRVSLLQERLSRLTPEGVDAALAENVELKVTNEALNSENRTYKNLVNEAHGIVEQLRIEQSQQHSQSRDYGEVASLRAELDQTKHTLTKSQVAIQRYESQVSLFDKESRVMAQKVKQLELDLSSSNNKLSEANNTINRYKSEIVGLEEEIKVKSDTLRKFKDDISASTTDISLVSRQMQELQDRLKRSEEEKEEILQEKEALRKGLERAESHIRVKETLQQGGNNPSNSPVRNSLDVLESKLLKELGHAHRRVTDLEKQTNLSHGERDQLITQARRTGQDLMIGIKSMQLLAGKIVEVAFPNKVISSEGVETLEQAVEQVEVLCRDILIELEESRMTVRDLDTQILRSNENLNHISKERDELANSLSAVEVQLQKVQLDFNTKTSELRQVTEMNRNFQGRIREFTEGDAPKLQREAEKANERIRQLNHFVENYEATLKQTQLENEDLSKKYGEVQQVAVKGQAELSELREVVQRITRQRDDLIEKIERQDSAAQAIQKKLDDLQGRVGHSEKVKSVVEEQFNRELKAVHSANGELKGQLSVALAARNELSQRVDRLSQLLRESERGHDDFLEKGRSTENQLSTLRREHEILLLEHKNLENDLVEKQASFTRLEQEISKLRREDQMARRTNDGLEHLQAKVESLSAMNSFLKDQTETRERTIRSLEDRLRHQQEEMRHAREEVDGQTRKLKKRELLISQALKRLESINHMKGMQGHGIGLSSSAGNSTSNNNHTNNNTDSPFRDDHHPSLLTPTRPTKRPSLHDEY